MTHSKQPSKFEHTVGSHSDDRGGDSDQRCTCQDKKPTTLPDASGETDWLDAVSDEYQVLRRFKDKSPVAYQDFKEEIANQVVRRVLKRERCQLIEIREKLPEKGWRIRTIGRRSPRQHYIDGYNSGVKEVTEIIEKMLEKL